MNIRNFCIIAHIDHGKSSLADRFLEITDTLSEREMNREQILDRMELEQERGITIKLQPARMEWVSKTDKKTYILNLIDTPGHADFSYEVSRSLAACEGALLLVDATQGVQAQTLSTFEMALEHNLHIIPVINKIDLPAADIEKTLIDLKQVFGILENEVSYISAKTGQGVEDILEKICTDIPSPKPLKEVK
jgi:GTP-binding protein LepA